MKTIKLSKVCSCGKGYRSRIDGKCGHCRSKKEAALFTNTTMNSPITTLI